MTDEKFATADREDFMMAFQAATWLDGVRDDPYYVKWMATYWIFENGEYSTRSIPMRDCTDSDFEKFYPPSKESKSQVDSFRNDGGLVCIDWQAAELELAGTWISGDSYTSLQVALVPCHRR